MYGFILFIKKNRSNNYAIHLILLNLRNAQIIELHEFPK